MGKRFLGIFLAAALLLPTAAFAEGENTPPYRVTVNLTENIVTVYGKDDAGGFTAPVRAFACSSGNNTPTGIFRTTDKYTWRLLFGNVYGQYATRITGSILFHSVPYFKQDKSTLEYDEYNKLGTTASAGCIRMTAADAKWIYDNCPSGTVVEMYRGGRKEPLQPAAPAKIDTADPRKGWDPTDPDPGNPWMAPAAEETGGKATDVPPEWLRSLLKEEQDAHLAEKKEEMQPEAFRLQAAGSETAYTVKGLRVGGEFYLAGQDAKRAFAHLGLTVVLERGEEGKKPMIRYDKTLHGVSVWEIEGKAYVSLREIAQITGVEGKPAENGGFVLRRKDKKVWIDPSGK